MRLLLHVDTPAENRCNVTKAKVPKLRSASSVDGMTSRRTQESIC